MEAFLLVVAVVAGLVGAGALAALVLLLVREEE